MPRASNFGVTLFFWYFFNAVFAIFNKRTLNVFPYPWLLSWIQARAASAHAHIAAARAFWVGYGLRHAHA